MHMMTTFGDCLFDKKKPHFMAWIWMNNIDNHYYCDQAHIYGSTTQPEQPHEVPLYYTTLFGFHDLAERLLGAHLQGINSQGRHHGSPLNAASHREHLNIVLFLLEHGADMESWGCKGQTALYRASSHGYAKVVWSPINCSADPNAECEDQHDCIKTKLTLLLVALDNGRLEIARMLLKSGTNMEAQGSIRKTSFEFSHLFTP